jgi:hypothetical protein
MWLKLNGSQARQTLRRFKELLLVRGSLGGMTLKHYIFYYCLAFLLSNFTSKAGCVLWTTVPSLYLGTCS